MFKTGKNKNCCSCEWRIYLASVKNKLNLLSNRIFYFFGDPIRAEKRWCGSKATRSFSTDANRARREAVYSQVRLALARNVYKNSMRNRKLNRVWALKKIQMSQERHWNSLNFTFSRHNNRLGNKNHELCLWQAREANGATVCSGDTLRCGHRKFSLSRPIEIYQGTRKLFVIF